MRNSPAMPPISRVEVALLVTRGGTRLESELASSREHLPRLFMQVGIFLESR